MIEKALGHILPRGERFKTTPLMRLAYWCLQAPPLYAGLILLLPFDTFASANSYKLMAQIGSEPFWAVISLCVPAVSIIAWYRRTDASISTALMLSGIWHGTIGLMFLMASPGSVIPGSLIVLAVLNCLLAMRI
jgi:hypothetical protein